MNMFGKKVIMVPTPPIMPSFISEISQLPAFAEVRPPSTAPESHSKNISKRLFIRSPTKKVRKNTTAMMPRNMGMPHILWVKALSSLSVSLSCRCLCTITSSIISSINSYFSFIICDSQLPLSSSGRSRGYFSLTSLSCSNIFMACQRTLLRPGYAATNALSTPSSLSSMASEYTMVYSEWWSCAWCETSLCS